MARQSDFIHGGGDPVLVGTPNDAAAIVAKSPNGHIPTALLQDTESAEIPVPVPDGDKVTVYRWGGYKIADGSAPSGLDVELLDGSDTVVHTQNTTDTKNSSGITDATNSTGSFKVYKLRVANDTGSDFLTDGVAAHFGYTVTMP